MEYKVILNEYAILDIQNAKAYIIEQYQDPVNAEKWEEDVLRAIYSLRTFPERFARFEIEPWFSAGFRSMKVRHCKVIFEIKNDSQTVYINMVKYVRMDFAQIKPRLRHRQ